MLNRKLLALAWQLAPSTTRCRKKLVDKNMRDKIMSFRNPGTANNASGFTRTLLLLAAGTVFIGCSAPAHAQAAPTPQVSPSVAQPNVKLVIGGGATIKNNSEGTLTVEEGSLRFKTAKSNVDVPALSILDISTNEDSRQDITGAAHFAAMAIPYGGGRVLALFSHHVDVLTVEFKDSNGGCHGTVFVLAQGQAAPFKKQLLALGAKATVPLADPAAAAPTNK